MAFAAKAVIDKAAKDRDLAPGDTYLFNDPYDGGTHLNDIRLVRPLMRGGKVFAWLASVAHWLDVGGNVPGNFNAKATESFQEGFRVPPVKLMRGGVLQQDIVDILAANSRVPQSNWGDLNGQLNALDLGERRLHDLLDAYGDETIRSALSALSARAETLMRANIEALPDGTYSFEDFLDNDGVSDAPLRIALDLGVQGDRLRLDFSRSAPPCEGPLNIARSTTIACCYVALKHLFTDVPANAGCLEPIEFVVPETTLLGVSAPRPVGGYTETILRVIDVIFGAFAKAAPERANGSPFATINALSLAGWRTHGRKWVMFCFFGGGLGGNPEGDGLNHSNNPISTAIIPPVEILESLYPVMFTQWALRPDSGGPGRHRGGLGAIYEIEVLADGGAEVFLLGERGKYPPFGVNGGKAARSIDSSTTRRAARLRRRSFPRQPTCAFAAGRRCAWRHRAAAASAILARAIPAASRATCGSATYRARWRGAITRSSCARTARPTWQRRQSSARPHDGFRNYHRHRRRRHVH